MSGRTVYLMRGLPSTGKSYTARRLAGESGVVLETDEYFYTMVGDDPQRYDYDDKLLAAAREWNLDRFRQKVDAGVSPIVVDRGNGLNEATRVYARYAADQGYQVELREPESSWWQELRVLLKYKDYVAPKLLDEWAEALATRSRSTHRVPVATIRRWMAAWRHDLTVQQILDHESEE